MVFTHSGNSGDIVYSIPTIQHLSEGKEAIVYIKPAKYVYGNQYDFVKELLQQQGVTPRPFTPSDDNWNYFNWPGLKFDYDLDRAREQKQRGRIHIIKRYFDQFGIVKDHRVPWLKVDDLYKSDAHFALIHLTSRWNGLQYDWGRIYGEALQRHERVYFIGLQVEWLDFCIRFGNIEHLPTENLLEMARLIRDCEVLYCNQGVALTVCQGLGKEYYLVKNGDKTNCFLYTSNEHLIGAEYLVPGHTLNATPNSHFTTKVDNV